MWGLLAWGAGIGMVDVMLSVCVNVSARGRSVPVSLFGCVCVGGRVSLCLSVRLCLSWVVGCLCIFSRCDAIVLCVIFAVFTLTSFVLPCLHFLLVSGHD
jgi:hypothetical protein